MDDPGALQLTQAQLEALRGLTTPTVANAIDALDVRPRVGFSTRPEIACRFPELGAVVGYAATLLISARAPADPAHRKHRHAYWDYLASLPRPRIVVARDLDEPKAIGSFWGEVTGAIHRGLECVAVVTDGGVRDLDELRGLGLQVFAPSVITSAGYVHVVDFGCVVEVGGLEVRSGDLLHADQHGVLSVPMEIVDRIPTTAAAIRRRELEVVDLYHSGRFSLDSLKEIRPE